LAPDIATELHAVHSYSIVTLMGGTCVLGLETGEVALGVGDIVTIPAIVHQWRAGPAGCQFSSMRFGIE
jgi:quercetin dioxygenase-like cupin family protein